MNNEDMHHFDEDIEQDDDTNMYDSDPEHGPANNQDLEQGSENNSDYNSNTDSAQEIQLPVPASSNRKRGMSRMTRLTKLRTKYTNSGGKKKYLKFDELGRFSRKHRALFVSFLGDLVREKVGISVLCWKDVTAEVREKLWEVIRVNILS